MSSNLCNRIMLSLLALGGQGLLRVVCELQDAKLSTDRFRLTPAPSPASVTSVLTVGACVACASRYLQVPSSFSL